jgi:hypothetical protein
MAGISILLSIALVVIFYGGPPGLGPRGPNVLFQGSYSLTTVDLTVNGTGPNTSDYLDGASNVSVGSDRFTVEFAQAPGLTAVYGFVTDARGLTFPFSTWSQGPLNLSDHMATWGSPDGNAEVAWISMSGHTASIVLGSRESQWKVASEPFPRPSQNLCGGQTSTPVTFGGAYWTESASWCYSPGGGNTEWTVTLPSGNADGWGLGGPIQSACSLPFSPHIACPPTTDYFGWYDPEAPLGMAISSTQVFMLAMS